MCLLLEKTEAISDELLPIIHRKIKQGHLLAADITTIFLGMFSYFSEIRCLPGSQITLKTYRWSKCLLFFSSYCPLRHIKPCAGQTIINDIKHLIPPHSDSLGFFFFKPEALNNHLLNYLSTNNRQVSSIEKVVI